MLTARQRDELPHRPITGDVAVLRTARRTRRRAITREDQNASVAKARTDRRGGQNSRRCCSRGDGKRRSSGNDRRSCGSGGGGGLNRRGDGATQKFTARKRAGEYHLLDDNRRSKRAEDDPERQDDQADGILDRVNGRGWVDELKTWIGHEIQKPLGHQ